MICLASKSPGRLSTLRAAGVDPLVRVSTVDEAVVLTALASSRAQEGRPAPGPAEQVQELALAKAGEVAARTLPTEAEVVVGCDSMLEIDGRAVGKPRTPERARECWLAMRGRSGVLHSGHALVRTEDGERALGVSSTVVRFGCPTLEEIDAYIATGEPLWCAGAFTIDGLGGAFIEGVDGDPHGVVGLSLPLLRRLLAGLGVRWTALWARD
ncbi:Maf family protein [Actinomyces oricola]